jgi:hypothetical protein
MVPGRLAVNNAGSQRDTCRRGTLAVLFRMQRNVYVRDRAGAAAGCFTAFACHRLQLLREFASRQTRSFWVCAAALRPDDGWTAGAGSSVNPWGRPF